MILVTGERGLIGSELLSALQQLPGVLVAAVADTNEASELACVESVDWVFHMGAVSETTAQDWSQLCELNIESTKTWAQWCEDQGAGLTYASSASVYGPWSNSPEWGPVQPLHLYGVSKLTVDAWMQSQTWQYPKQGMRFFNVYGRNEGHKAQPSPVRRFIEQAITQRRVTVWQHEGRLGSRDFVSIDDCIDAMLRLKACRAATGVYNIGTGQQLTFMHIAQSLQRKFGIANLQIQTVPMPSSMVPTYQWESCADVTKLRRVLGDWNPKTVDEWLDANFDGLYNKINEEIK